MRLQRVRGAESRIEKQFDKWTVEGVGKSLGRVFYNVTPALRVRGVLALCKGA